MDLGRRLDAAERVEAPAAATPEEWSPEQQIAHLLRLCDAQMESALCESDLAIDALIKVFTTVAEAVRALEPGTHTRAHAGAHTDAHSGASGPAQYQAQLDAVGRQMAGAVVAFQFYDKLSQRLGHVRHSLSSLARLVCDDAQSGQRERWQALFTQLRSAYRTEEERQIFRRIVDGASLDAAREHMQSATPARRPATGDDIELF